MRIFIFLALLTVAACNSNEESSDVVINDPVKDTPATPKVQQEEKPVTPPPAPKTYSNQRFREVTVEKTGEHTYRISGKAQIFEASFSWVVEDGHNELKKGYEMTDAGAPAWGNFNFTLEVKKQRENSTLILLLFESSAKDGSRQYQLPIALP